MTSSSDFQQSEAALSSETPSSHPIMQASTSRYPPHLARDPKVRTPLAPRTHTYERLEDLLREAGYKETRVFTPEAERLEEEGQVRGRSLLSMGAVVGFIAGLVRSGSASGEETKDVPDSSQGRLSAETTVDDLSISTSSLSSLDVPRFSRASSRSGNLSMTSSIDTTKTVPHQLDYLHRQLPHPRPPLRSHAPNSQRQPPSQARAYLRHMSSVPNMAQRPTAPSHRPSHMRQSSLILGGDFAPPLPSTWLETVAKAVLGSGNPEAHVGGPSKGKSTKLSASRAYKTKRPGTALSDSTNTRNVGHGQSSSNLAPRPTMLMTRSMSSMEPVVSTTQVVCRSAPASRCPSRAGSVRGGSRGRAGQKRRRDADKDRVPSLASTRVEGDLLWSLQSADWSMRSFGDDGDVEYSSDEEEGELDLARLLVPAKRQNSIKSLRRHLIREDSLSRAWNADWQGETIDWRERDGEEEGCQASAFERSGTKRRRGIPNGWVQW